jgi:hypothetical protein
VGDCPECGFASPGAVDFCPNPQCRTYLGWASAMAPAPVDQSPTTDTQQIPPVPAHPPDGSLAVQTNPAPGPTAGPVQKRGVRVTVEPAELTVDPGSEVTTTAAVRNLGTRVEEFQLIPRGPAAAYTSITPPMLSVYPDDEQRAVVRFAPPRGPQSLAGVAPLHHGPFADPLRRQRPRPRPDHHHILRGSQRRSHARGQPRSQAGEPPGEPNQRR